ncbi:MAG TPA: tryptophan synthase subunit alpha [Acidobacteriaceae bacterium]|nr:tryptophan synthase subunit alpha [Acidobacteriaceae bacterium]
MAIQFQQKPGLVAYLTIGDPDLSTSKKVALAAIDAGADVLELGVPFSDPLADGPVIQRASQRAVRNGITLADVLAVAKDLRRERSDAGLVIFSYLNPILRMGLDAFARSAELAGIDAVLVVDMIPEESDVYRAVLRKHHLQPVFLAAPTSDDARLQRVAEVSEGFIYAISRVGITGTQQQVAGDARDLVTRLRRYTTLPIALGFGISNATHVAAVAEYADVAVVGSAIVALIEQSTADQAPDAVGAFVAELRARRPVEENVSF